MDSAQRVKIDKMLDELGVVSPDLSRFIERYLGSSLISLRDADRLLAELDRKPLDRGPLLETPTADTRSSPEHSEGRRVADGGETAPIESGRAVASPQSSRVSPFPSIDAATLERDSTAVPNQRKGPLAQGLTGIDELPDFPVTRSLATAKSADDVRTFPKPTESTIGPDADSFEILVDEEILEIEPEDSILDE